MRVSAWKALRSSLSLVVVAVAGAGACDPCEGLEGPVSAELGTGFLDTFTSLAVDGASLPYVRGLQGGTHVDGAVRVTGLYVPPEADTRLEEQPLTTLSLHDGETLVGGFSSQPRTFFQDDAGVSAVHAEPVIFFEDASIWVGTTLRFFVEVEDRCQQRVTDERSITIRDAGN